MEFSEKTLSAIAKAVKDKEPIDDLEFLGVSTRTLSILGRNGITTMDRLMTKTKKQLSDIKSLNSPSVNKMVDCLQNYDKLADLRM